VRIRSCGEAHLLIELEDLHAASALHRNLEAAALAGVLDLVPAARTVLLEFDPDVTTPSALTGRVETLLSRPAPPRQTEPIRVAVRYDGPDLGFVSDFFGMGVREFVTWHTGQAWTVAFSGFAPGFAYCVTDAAHPDVPRLDTPRVAVPPGAVAMAGEFTGVYPRSSPGGWRLLGRTDAVLWDERRDPPALLRPGVSLCFDEAR
jgi:KipI family sensor histidine kinase inhibitor